MEQGPHTPVSAITRAQRLVLSGSGTGTFTPTKTKCVFVGHCVRLYRYFTATVGHPMAKGAEGHP